jgi:hypothetical protein
MIDVAQERLIDLLRKSCATGQLTQLGIAVATGVHQSQVSRILAGCARRPSKNLLALCKYAESHSGNGATRDSTNAGISAALLKLTGKSYAEDEALTLLLTSLAQWRSSWGVRDE